MKVIVNGNRQEQIKRGIEPWDKAEVEISLATLTEKQRALLAEADSNWVLIEATPEALTAELQSRLDARAEEARLVEERNRKMDDDARFSCAHAELTKGQTNEFGVIYETFSAPYISHIYLPSDDTRRLVAATLDRLQREAKEKTDASRASVAEQIEAAKSAHVAKEQAAKEAELAREQAKFAKRLETGVVEISMERGDRREWGEPWIAKLSSRNGKRPEYDFAEGSYDAANETLSIPCKPGEIIAYGQKNHKKANRTIHNVRKMTDDGRLVKA